MTHGDLTTFKPPWGPFKSPLSRSDSRIVSHQLLPLHYAQQPEPKHSRSDERQRSRLRDGRGHFCAGIKQPGVSGLARPDIYDEISTE